MAEKKGKKRASADIVVVEDSGPVVRSTRLKKHVALVHAFSGLSLLQRKVVNVLLWKAYYTKDEAKDFWFSTSITELRERVGYTGHNYEWLKEGIRSLKGVSIEYDILGEGLTLGEAESGGSPDPRDDIVYLSCVPFINVYVYRSGAIRYQLNPGIAEELLDPQMYAYLDMDEQRRFSSKWGHALYETVARFAAIGSTGMRPLETWRRLFGVRPGTYKDFTKFSDNVLKPAIDDLHAHTSYRVRAEVKRTSQRYSHMRIVIQRPETARPELSSAQGRLFEAMYAKGVTKRIAVAIVKEHRERDIRRALEELNHRCKQTELRNPGGWFVNRLRSLAEQSRASESMAPLEVAADVGTDVQDVPDEQQALPSIAQMSLEFDVDPEAVWDDFVSSLNRAEQMLYKRSGRDHPAIRSAYRRFLEKQ